MMHILRELEIRSFCFNRIPVGKPNTHVLVKISDEKSFDVPGYVKDEKFGLGEFEKKEENLESKLVCDENREREEFGLRMSE